MRPGLTIAGSAGVIPAGYFVAPSGGSDSNTGGIADPFATLSKAQTAMRASSTKKRAYFRGGAYSTLGAAITLTASDNGCAYLNYPGEIPAFAGNGTFSCFQKTGSPTPITIDGLKMSTFLNSIKMDTVTGWTLANNIIDADADAGIWMQNSASLIITGNEIKNSGGAATTKAGIYGLATASGNLHDIIIQNNSIHDQDGPGIYVNADAGSGHALYNILIDRNTVLRVNQAEGFTDSGGIQVMNRGYTSPMGGVISNNTVEDVGGNGASDGLKCIYLDDRSSNWQIYGNTLKGPATYAIQYHGGALNDVYDNHIDVTNMYKLGYYQDAGSPYTGMAGNKFRSNIVICAGAWPFATPWNYSLHAGEADPIVQDNRYWSSTAVAFPNSGSVIDASPIYPVSNPW